MKKIALLITAALLLVTLISCTKNDDNKTDDNNQTNTDNDNNNSVNSDGTEKFDYENSDLDSMVKLGEYTGLTVTQASAILTDEEFEEEIDALLAKYSYYEQITDRAVEEGDTVSCYFAGYRDGELFDGGSAQNAQVTVMSNSGYIPGFAEAFEGQKVGEEFSFNVTFPEDYNEELGGVEVTFVCTVNYIYGEEITPELTDEFVHEKFNYNNAEEFKISYRTTVSEQKAYYVQSNMYTDLWLKIVDNATVLVYPESEVDRVYNERRAYYEEYAKYFQTDYDTFIANYVNITDDEIKESCRTYVKEDLVMYKMIDELGIKLTDEQYEEGYAFFANYYGMTKDELMAHYGEDTIRSTVIWQEMMEILASKNNVIVE